MIMKGGDNFMKLIVAGIISFVLSIYVTTVVSAQTSTTTPSPTTTISPTSTVTPSPTSINGTNTPSGAPKTGFGQ